MHRAATAAPALAAVVAALVVPSAATPTPPGRNGLIAFVASDAGSPKGIAVIAPDGRGFMQLTKNRLDRSPTWSPDGRRLAFERGGDIYVMRANGRRLRRLTRHLGARQPAWAPDAKAIAFIRKGALFVMRTDGTRQRRLYRRRAVLANRPSWSPNGKRIAFGVFSDDEHGAADRGSIVVIGRGGGNVRYVTDGRGMDTDGDPPETRAEDRGPDWSPDGKRILFTRLVWLCPRCDEDRVFSASPDGTSVVSALDEWSWAPSWSPDGRLLVAATSNGLAIFTAAGPRLGTLSHPGSAPAWQPQR